MDENTIKFYKSEIEMLKSQRDYLDNKLDETLKINQSFAKSVLDLGDKVREQAKQIDHLEGQVKYWKAEADCDHGRWMRTLEDLDNLRRSMI